MKVWKAALLVAVVTVLTFPSFSYSQLSYDPVFDDSFNPIGLGVIFMADGEYGVVCNQGVSSDIRQLLCASFIDIGFYNESSSMINTTFTNFTCPSGLSSCTADVVSIGNCSSDGGRLVLQCSFLGGGCFPGQTELANSVSGSDSSMAGYPRVCVNGSLTPICNGTELDQFEILSICVSQGLDRGYVGAPPDVIIQPLNHTDYTAVTNYSCSVSPSFMCTASLGSCTDGYAIITCANGSMTGQVCNENTYGGILFNNYTTESNDGAQMITGIFQSCISGSYFRFCADQTQLNTPAIQEIATNSCMALNYTRGEALPFNSSLFSGSPPGITYLSTEYVPCSASDMDLVIRCTKLPNIGCAVSGISLYNNQTILSGGREVVTGIFTNCSTGHYTALCEDGSNGNKGYLCSTSLLGYQGGKTIPYNSSVHGILPPFTIYYSDFKCPANASSFNDCNGIFNGTYCNDILVLECYNTISTSFSISSTTSSVTSSISVSSISSTSSSPSPTSSSPTPTSDSDTNVGLIAGASVAAFVVVAAIIAVIVVVVAIGLYGKKHKSSVIPISEKKSHPI